MISNVIKFKHEEHKVSTLKRRLKSFYKLANQLEHESGRKWYKGMYQWIEAVAQAKDLDVMQACGIFAALSPQMSVDRNKGHFLDYVKTGTAKHYGTLVDKCDEILEAKTQHEIVKILNGPKITAFFLNIWNYDRSMEVTVDRHALATMLQTASNVKPLDDGQYSMTANQYKAFEKVYSEVAQELSLFPHQLQAILWDTYRRLRDLKLYQHEVAPF